MFGDKPTGGCHSVGGHRRVLFVDLSLSFKMPEGKSHFQLLPAMGANLLLTRIVLPAIKTGSQRRRGLGFSFPGQKPLLSLARDEVEGEKND